MVLLLETKQNEMKPPKTSIAEILYTLINSGAVSIIIFPYLSSFRSRLSDLRLKHGLTIKRVQKTKLNKFKNSYTYVVHKLDKSEKEKAIKVYNELNK